MPSLTISFISPFVILGTVFALHGVYPFGGKHILVYDLFQQHYPLLSNFWYKFREGSISSWSWTAGAGHDYIVLFAYFLASPLNFLIFLFPHAWLCEVLTFVLLIKISCAGLFTCIFLRYAYKPNPMSKQANLALAVFPALYSLCAFTLGYFWSLNSFDSFALLPLVVLGTYKLINEGKWKLYVVSLALAMFANFYYSFFVCIFATIAFFGQCFVQKLNRHDFIRKLGLIAGCSALAIGMTAVLLVPSWVALQNTVITENTMPKPVLYTSFFNILGNFTAFTPLTILKGLPNLYSGMISIMLTGWFLFSQKVSRREKIAFGIILVFLLLSCNFSIFDYVIHGFHITRDVPFRFTFLISFILIATAYRGFLLTESIGKRGIVGIGLSASFILLSAVLGSQEREYIISSTVMCILFLILLFYFWRLRDKNNKKALYLTSVIFLLAFVELFISSYIAIDKAELKFKDDYPDQYDNQIKALLDRRSSDKGRTEIGYLTVNNASSLYNYNGISFFSSTVNFEFTKFLYGLGTVPNPASVNIQYASNSTPLTDAFFNIRYVINHKGSPMENIIYWEPVSKDGDLLLFENKRYLPFAFMVNENLINYTKDDKSPFVSQNNLFRLATGLDGNLFTITKLEDVSNSQKASSYQIKTPSDGLYYRYIVFYNKENYNNEDGLIKPIGYIEKDRNVTLQLNNKADVFFGCLDINLFEQGYKQLANQPLVLTKFTDTEVCGTVEVLEDGLLYTSIPTDRNWSVYVNGEKSEIVLIGNAMAAVRLKKGYHQIEFRYFNKSLAVGAIITLVSIAVFIVLVLLKNKKGNKGLGSCL